MKKFDLDRALAGDKIVCRNGYVPQDFHYFDIDIDYPIFCVIDNRIHPFTKNGLYVENVNHMYDLFMQEEEPGKTVVARSAGKTAMAGSEGTILTNTFMIGEHNINDLAQKVNEIHQEIVVAKREQDLTKQKDATPKINYFKFTLDRMLKGDKVVCRNGLIPEKLFYLRDTHINWPDESYIQEKIGGSYTIMAIIDGDTKYFRTDGKHKPGPGLSDFDLFMKYEEKF